MIRCWMVAVGEPCARIEMPRLRPDEHGQGKLVRPWQHSLDEQQSPVGCDSPSAILQDTDSWLVFPIVDDVADQIGIAARWHCLEKVTPDDLAAVRDPCRLQILWRPGHNLRPVKEHALQGRVRLQHAGQQSTLVSTHIHEHVRTREVIGQDRSLSLPHPVAHSGVEQSGQVWFCVKVLEYIHPRRPLPGGVSRLHRVEQIPR
jgi:hypothetical protein